LRNYNKRNFQLSRKRERLERTLGFGFDATLFCDESYAPAFGRPCLEPQKDFGCDRRNVCSQRLFLRSLQARVVRGLNGECGTARRKMGPARFRFGAGKVKSGVRVHLFRPNIS